MSALRPPQTLERLPIGRPAVVRGVGPAHAQELVREGVLPGARIRVRSRAPLRGPIILEVSGAGAPATVAVSRSIAATVLVETEGTP